MGQAQGCWLALGYEVVHHDAVNFATGAMNVNDLRCLALCQYR